MALLLFCEACGVCGMWIYQSILLFAKKLNKLLFGIWETIVDQLNNTITETSWSNAQCQITVKQLKLLY